MPAVNLITELPRFVSREEHATLVGSTPSSFSDIPPVLRHKEENVTVSLDPAVEGFTETDAAQGTLYVLTSVLVYMSSTGKGFQVEYPSITLHAISRGDSPSIYCQLDEPKADGDVMLDSEDAEEEELTDMRELSLIPSTPNSLESIFEALSQCASLHPDSDVEEDDFNEAFIDNDGSFETFSGDEEEELSEVGRVRSNFANDNRYTPY
ncbi:regulator of volume decrease after cellular swelling-domain-containing protein [Cyathus striatus]|nr:regulator of volume decrease after cellular swelling-domain-containing protein [Cyathus striatus]